MATNFNNNSISKIELNELTYNIKSIPFYGAPDDWAAMDYVPKKGEFILYDYGNNAYAIKIGDGVTKASNISAQSTVRVLELEEEGEDLCIPETLGELDSALAANNMLVLKYNNIFYPFEKEENDKFYFSAIVDGKIERFELYRFFGTVYANHETTELASVEYVDTALETKQNKNVIVTKDAEGKATMTPAEIIAHINAGDSVYFTENLGNDTYHPFLEGNDRVSGFYSNYFDEDVFIANHFEIKSDRTITKSVWQPTFDEQIANHFLIVQTVKSGENYLLDGMTFEEIQTRFGEGINMVCRVDGTDYIPLLSVTPNKIMFSGIYQTTSVSLDFTSDGVGRLTSLSLASRDAVTTAISNHNTNKSAHSEIFYTKTEIDNIIPVVEAITVEQIDEICGVVAAN